jgi:two-component system NarL family sensor kinase
MYLTMRLLRRSFLMWIFLVPAIGAHAQMGRYNKIFQHDVDSLKVTLARHPDPDTVRTRSLIDILEIALFASQKRQLMPYWAEALQLSRKLRYRRGMAACLEWRGTYFKGIQKPDSALLYYDSAISAAGTTADPWMRKARGFVLFERGMLYEYQENFYTALNTYFESLKNYDGLAADKQKMVALRIADIYKKLRDDTKALEYYQVALTYYLQANNGVERQGADGLYTSIASIYFNRNDLADAESWLIRMKHEMPDTNETILTGGYYHLVGEIASRRHQTDTAIAVLKEALRFFNYTEQMHTDDISATATDIARLELDKHNLGEAKKYATMALASARRSGLRESLADAYGAMAAYYHAAGDQLSAYQALDQATALSDSVLDETNVKQAATLSAIYENGKKEREIAQLESDKKMQAAEVKQKTLLSIVFIIAFIAILIVGVATWINLQNKRKLERQRIAELEKEKQLAGVEAMLKGEESERSRLAKDLHDGLGGMLSGTKMSFSTVRDHVALTAEGAALFEKSIRQLDNTIAELRKVAHNMMPEALVKYGLGSAVADFCESMQLAGNTRVICEQYGADRTLDNSAAVNVYRIIQELVNNAVIHGKAGQILVQLSVTPDQVLITVEDNGKGFDKGATGGSPGIGLNNIRTRVNYFNGRMELLSGPGEGTVVNIELRA